MPRANTKIRPYYRLCHRSGGRDFEILHALRCVLGTSEAPFLCIHAVNTTLKLPSWFQNDIQGPSAVVTRKIQCALI